MPPRWDVLLIARLAGLLGRWPPFDLLILESVAHGILGGLWYAAAIFLFWVRGMQPGGANLRHRTLTLALGSLTASLLTVVASDIISFPPPSTHPELAALFPVEFPANTNPNSFPSQSTALYSAISAGLYALRRRVGILAWVLVGTIVALPRMYLGGHYATDVVAGVLLGVGGYWIAVLLLHHTVARSCAKVFERRSDDKLRILAELAVFFWILQVAAEFGLARWIIALLLGARD
jgi:undecaprenyl-diphosphatase